MTNLIQGRSLIVLKTVALETNAAEVKQDLFEYRVSSLSPSEIEALRDVELSMLYRSVYFIGKPMSEKQVSKFLSSAVGRYENRQVKMIDCPEEMFLPISYKTAAELIEDALKRRSLENEHG